MRSVFSYRERPVTTKARSDDRASSSNFCRLPAPKWTLSVGRKVWVPPLMALWYCYARLSARGEILSRRLEGQVRGSSQVAGLILALHPVMVAGVGGKPGQGDAVPDDQVSIRPLLSIGPRATVLHHRGGRLVGHPGDADIAALDVRDSHVRELRRGGVRRGRGSAAELVGTDVVGGAERTAIAFDVRVRRAKRRSCIDSRARRGEMVVVRRRVYENSAAGSETNEFPSWFVALRHCARVRKHSPSSVEKRFG